MQLRKLIREIILLSDEEGDTNKQSSFKVVDIAVDGLKKWQPLYAFLEPIFGDDYKRAANGFMFMNGRAIEGGPANGKELFWYKHGISRKYIVLDEDGNPYELEMTGDELDHITNLRPQSHEAAYQKVYGTIEKFIQNTPSHGDPLPNGVLSDYKTYKAWRDKFAADNGYNVQTFTKDDLHEATRSREQKLKDNKVKLTDEERAEIITKGATWTDGKPGIWKSISKSGKTYYCSNTHRAMAVSTTLSAAIKKFPFIKSTS